MNKIYIGNNSFQSQNGNLFYPFESPSIIQTISRIGWVDSIDTDSTSRITTGVTVPTGTDIAIISCVYGYGAGSIVEAGADEISLGGVEATTIDTEADASHGTVYSCYVLNPTPGVQTLAIDATGTATYGPSWGIVYYSGVNTTSPIYSHFNNYFSDSYNSYLPRIYEPISYPTSGMTIGIWWANNSASSTVAVSGQTEVFRNNIEGSGNMIFISEEFESDQLALEAGRYVSLVGFTLNPSIGV